MGSFCGWTGFLSAIDGTTSLNYGDSSDQASPQVYFGISATSWAKVGVIVALFAALFWPNLRRLWLKTNPFTGEANWGHSVCVPIIGLYYLYVHREDLQKAGSRQFIWASPWRAGRLWAGIAMILTATAVMAAARFTGDSYATIKDMALTAAQGVAILGVLVLLLDWSLAVTLMGIAMYAYGIYPGQNDYLKDLGMVVTLYGIVLMMCGPAVMRIAWFPIVFLICGIPWPGLVYSWIASPLQALAASVAVVVLKATGVNAMVSGTKIIIYGATLAQTRTLNVAEACAGMRSLMTFITVGGAVGFLSDRSLWEKLIITMSAVPIAIFCNVMRVSGQGLLDHYVSQKLSESFAHQFVGMIMLVPAFFLILMVGYVLDRIFVAEADSAESPAPGSPPAPAMEAIAPPPQPERVAAIAPAKPKPMTPPVSAVAAAPAARKSAIPAPSTPRPVNRTTPPRPQIPMSPSLRPELRIGRRRFRPGHRPSPAHRVRTMAQRSDREFAKFQEMAATGIPAGRGDFGVGRGRAQQRCHGPAIAFQEAAGGSETAVKHVAGETGGLGAGIQG